MNPKNCIIQSLTKEEQALLYFAEPVGYHMRLQQYLEHPQGFEARTIILKSKVSLSTTKTFRCYLLRFIHSFKPELLLPNSNLWLHLEKTGRFSLRLGKKGEEITSLNESDFYAFQYLCFLHIRRFWHIIREHCRFPTVNLPLFVKDFSSQIKECADYDALLQRSIMVSTQVIIL